MQVYLLMIMLGANAVRNFVTFAANDGRLVDVLHGTRPDYLLVQMLSLLVSQWQIRQDKPHAFKLQSRT